MARRLSIGRLRGGELLAGAGAVVLVVSLFLEWAGPVGESGWDALGWLVLALVVIALLCAAALVALTAADRPVTHIVAAAVLTATAAPIALLALVLRALVFQPGPNELVTVEGGAWIGLAGAALLAIGAWWSLADERTDAPESAYVPPAPRPAPPPASS
jgi:hypothetical protein